MNARHAAWRRGASLELTCVIIPSGQSGQNLPDHIPVDIAIQSNLSGPYTVLVVADRFDRLERAVAIAADERVEVRLWMRPRGGSIYESVTVTGKEDKIIRVVVNGI